MSFPSCLNRLAPIQVTRPKRSSPNEASDSDRIKTPKYPQILIPKLVQYLPTPQGQNKPITYSSKRNRSHEPPFLPLHILTSAPRQRLEIDFGANHPHCCVVALKPYSIHIRACIKSSGSRNIHPYTVYRSPSTTADALMQRSYVPWLS
jgi:hypothetical protein